MNRRELITKVFIGGTVIALAPDIITSCTKTDVPGGTNSNKATVDLTDQNYSALNSAGGSALISKYGIIIANTGNDVFVALDSTCTHQGCTIGYNKTSNNFPCPCHGSVFSTNGAVITGPAQQSVQSHTVTKAGNTLTIDLG